MLRFVIAFISLGFLSGVSAYFGAKTMQMTWMEIRQFVLNPFVVAYYGLLCPAVFFTAYKITYETFKEKPWISILLIVSLHYLTRVLSSFLAFKKVPDTFEIVALLLQFSAVIVAILGKVK